jgi:starvation-inducible DNA-binding protein
MQKSAKREPDALRTPTDLTNKKVSAISEALNNLVADAFALYVKTKNFHWHMSGPHFRDYHLLLDEQAEQIFASIDPLAERVRKLGERTVTGLGQISSLASVQDAPENLLPVEMLRALMEDNKAMAAAMRKAHETCDDNDDPASAGLLETFIDEAERRTWFLFEATRGVND